jgi:predicted outer membrane repeat protein
MIITVTNTNDSGAGSLRQAIANAVAGDTIAFASGLANQTITLTSGQLTVNKNLIFDGAAAANLKISGNNASRVFEVQALGATFRNLTIVNGRATGSNKNGAGGAIKTGESGTILTVENCQFNNNFSDYGGGAIFSGYKANTTIINSKFIGNNGTGAKTERGGGAIATDSAGTLVVKGSEFTNNKGINGGAIYSVLVALTVENSTFKNNDTIVSKPKSFSQRAIFTEC